MAHVVTQACAGDASCVFACPVNAIHPTPDEADFGLAEMLYIDPVSCVDCGACVTACPVGAISPDTKIAEHELPFVEINALFHAEPRSYPVQAPVTPIVPKVDRSREVVVAVVGAGPAAMYAADELLKRPGVRVNVFDRLPTPHGLVRAGVAPDHPSTKTVADLFRHIEDTPGFGYVLGVEVGRDITHDEVLEHHDAVIYATGASQDRSLGVPGEDLDGSITATEFVAWYNGHPDHAHRTYDLSHERAVIIGNGNVALDVARILATDPDRLATTDIADHALEVLRWSAVREVVVVARRGVAQAAFTLPELTGLLGRDDIDVVVDPGAFDDLLSTATDDVMTRDKVERLRAASARAPRPGRRRVVLRFQASPVEVLGTGAVSGVRLASNDLTSRDGSVVAVPSGRSDVVEAGLVLRSIGYHGRAVPGVPFDERAGVIPHVDGRVAGAARTYVTGWIKRGPQGFIGTNKSCATETVNALFDDLNAGLLPGPARRRTSLDDLVASRTGGVIDLDGWRAIDLLERRRGAAQQRTRRKLTDVGEMLEAARGATGARRGTRRRKALLVRR